MLITGRQHHQIMNKHAQPFITGIKWSVLSTVVKIRFISITNDVPLLPFDWSLDELLDGGLLSGNIIDVCGLSGTGKTLLCRTIATNLAINYHLDTYFIDTKGDFSAEAIHKMLVKRKISSETQRKQTMRHIKAIKCRDPNELIHIIQTLIDDIEMYAELKMLVIDSMPAIWFNMYGMNTSYAHRTLVTLLHKLRRLAVEHGIIIIAVNIVTTPNSNGEWIEYTGIWVPIRLFIKLEEHSKVCTSKRMILELSNTKHQLKVE